MLYVKKLRKSESLFMVGRGTFGAVYHAEREDAMEKKIQVRESKVLSGSK